VKDLGREEVGGQTCRVFEYAPTSNPSWTEEIWISESLSFPVKKIVTTPDGKTTTVTYSNTKIDAPLPGDIFTIPGDVTITDQS